MVVSFVAFRFNAATCESGNRVSDHEFPCDRQFLDLRLGTDRVELSCENYAWWFDRGSWPGGEVHADCRVSDQPHDPAPRYRKPSSIWHVSGTGSPAISMMHISFETH